MVQEGSLVSVLELSLKQLDPATHQLRRFVEEGGYAELFVGWFFEGNSGDVLGWELMGRLSERRIALSLDIYPA